MKKNVAYLIITADDFGYSKLFSKKIVELMEKGFITSTSAMVNWIDDAQKDQVEKLKEFTKTKEVTIGLHVEFQNTSFREQIEQQFHRFQDIFGFPPMFLDIHKKTYLQDGYPVIMEYCVEKGIPCKNHGIYNDSVIMTEDPSYSGTGKTFDEIKAWVDSLSFGKIYLIAFHPGIYDPESKSSLNKEREKDAEIIVELNDLLSTKGIKLVSFKKLIG